MPAFEGRKAKVLTSQRFKFSTVRSYPMGTNAKHGTYLGTTLVGFTSLVQRCEKAASAKIILP